MMSGNWRALASVATIAVICATLIAVTAAWTNPSIKANRAEKANRLYTQLIPNSGTLVLPGEGNCEQGYVGLISVPGYAGDIEWVYRYHASRQTLALRTIAHAETPGIGDFIDSQRSPWLRERDHNTAAKWRNLDAISGATITWNALQQGIEQIASKDYGCE